MESKEIIKLYELEILETHLGHSFTEDHKQNVLSILNIFKDWATNPKGRELTIKSNGGEVENSFSLSSGLCGNISFIRYKLEPCLVSGWLTMSNDYLIRMREIFKVWPKFSGDLDYPIPSHEVVNGDNSGRDGLSHRDMYRHISACRLYSMYDRNTEYGRLRLELLDFVIECVEKDFDKYVNIC